MLPVEHNDPINAKILAVSEDKIDGFVREPFEEIANRSGVGVEVVMARIAAMLRAGTIRRVRQTLLATNLADGALVAWKVPEEEIDAAFDWMFQRDPFSGHVVVRSTDGETAGSEYRLWTTLKVPAGFSLREHGELLAAQIGADKCTVEGCQITLTKAVKMVIWEDAALQKAADDARQLADDIEAHLNTPAPTAKPV